MKRFTFLTFLTAAFLFSVVMMTSCTKEGVAGIDGVDGAVGPAGAQGIAGTNGLNGADGADGIDGTASCISCHDANQTISSKQFQWNASGHAAGSALGRSSSSSCAPCHSQQGFMLSDGNNPLTSSTWVGVDAPTTINCYTCHPIHKTWTENDTKPENLNYSDQPNWAVTLGKNINIDYGTGNLCAHCHQSRTRTPVVDMTNLDGITAGSISTHFGPHYSPQANVLGAFGAYEIEGSKDYPASGGNGHLGANVEGFNTCVTCHMGFTSSNLTGGHSFGIDPGNDLGKACATCHDEVTAETYYEEYYHDNFATVDNHGSSSATINTSSLYAKLGYALEAKGLYTSEVELDDNGYMDHVAFNISRGLKDLNSTLVAALFNHRYLYQDHSHGIHNPIWVKALLTNTLEAVEAL